MADVGDFMRHDQVVPCIDRGLHVVADNPGAFAAGRHRPRVGIGKRDLLIGRGAHCDGDLFELLQLLFQRRDLVF